MATQLTAENASSSLHAHATSKGVEIFLKYGPNPTLEMLRQLLEDRSCVRYPCTLAFDAGPLQPGECAHARPCGARPEDGFEIFVHPRFRNRPEIVPHLVLYQLVAVNYGDFASAADAEAFGAGALGLLQDEYYRMLCELADELAPPPG